jgi:DNA-binding MarR family transcriptional regulator
MATRTRAKPSAEDPAAHLHLLHAAATQMFDMRRMLRPLIQQAKALAAPMLAAPASEAQIHVLSVLADEEYLPAGELAARCHVTEPTMSRTLTLLEGQNLITRQTDPANRRTVQVRLTPNGREMLAASREALVEGLAQVLSPLTPAQLEDVIAALGHLQGLVDLEAHETKRKSHTDKEFT